MCIRDRVKAEQIAKSEAERQAQYEPDKSSEHKSKYDAKGKVERTAKHKAERQAQYGPDKSSEQRSKYDAEVKAEQIAKYEAETDTSSEQKSKYDAEVKAEQIAKYEVETVKSSEQKSKYDAELEAEQIEKCEAERQAQLVDQNVKAVIAEFLRGKDLAKVCLRDVRFELERRFRLEAGALERYREWLKGLVCVELATLC